jgi:hypothetical protein
MEARVLQALLAEQQLSTLVAVVAVAEIAVQCPEVLAG